MLSSMSKMLEKVGEGVAMAVSIAAGDLTLDELEEKVNECRMLNRLLYSLELRLRIVEGRRMVSEHYLFQDAVSHR